MRLVRTILLLAGLGFLVYLGAAPGLALSLVRRIREAAWIGLGFLALAALPLILP